MIEQNAFIFTPENRFPFVLLSQNYDINILALLNTNNDVTMEICIKCQENSTVEQILMINIILYSATNGYDKYIAIKIFYVFWSELAT